MNTIEENVINAGIELKGKLKSHSRYLSWEYCYKKFQDVYQNNIEINAKVLDDLSLNLGFYLASWGMYRGSTFLLNYDYKIHTPVIENVLFNNKYKELWTYNTFENLNKKTDKDIEEYKKLMLDIKKDIIDKYNTTIGKNEDVEDVEDVEATDTLVTKILLGTIGCIPAYDRYVKSALKRLQAPSQTLNKKSIKWLVDFCRNSNIFKYKNSVEYPPMKILDMCLWEYGEQLQRTIIVYQLEKNIIDEIESILENFGLKETVLIDDLENHLYNEKDINNIKTQECFMQIKGMENGKYQIKYRENNILNKDREEYKTFDEVKTILKKQLKKKGNK